MSVIVECVLWVGAAAPRTAAAAAATAVTAEIAVEEAPGMGTAPPPRLPPLTEIAAAGTEDAATTPAPTHTTSTRITAAAASTAAPGVALGQGVVEWARPHLLHQAPSL